MSDKIEYFELVTEEEQEKILNLLGTSKNKVEQDTKIVNEWLDSQPHLPKVLTDRQILAFLFMGKFSIERTKSKIDMYFSMRSIFPDIFDNMNPNTSKIKTVNSHVYMFPMPMLRGYDRLHIIAVKDVDPSDFDPLAWFAHLTNMVDIKLMEDFAETQTFVIDLKHAKLGHLPKFTPVAIKNVYTITEKAYTLRLTGIHLANTSSIIDGTLMLLKSIVKKKVSDKIIVHKNFESLHQAVDKNYLPKELGGNQKSYQEFQELFDKKIGEYQQFFDFRDEWKVNEELRPTKNINDDILGYYGNFKKLEVD